MTSAEGESARHRATSAAFASTLDVQLQYLKLNPAVPARFPSWMQRRQFEGKLESETVPALWWGYFKGSNLEEAGYQESEREKMITNAIIVRQLSIAKRATMTETEAGLIEFFPRDAVAQFELEKYLTAPVTSKQTS